MATMTDIEPREGDVIKGATGENVVCVVRGELFWNGQFVAAWKGEHFELISRSREEPSSEEMAEREIAKAKAAAADALDRKYM